MLGYTFIFLIISLIAGILGIGVIDGTADSITKICFFLFLVLFVAALLIGGRPRPFRNNSQPNHR